MTGRFDRPGLLAAVTGAAVLDGTTQVIRNVATHATARRPASTESGTTSSARSAIGSLPRRPHGSEQEEKRRDAFAE